MENKIEKLNNEIKVILKYFIENPNKPVPEKSVRLNELNEGIARVEVEWLEIVGDF